MGVKIQNFKCKYCLLRRSFITLHEWRQVGALCTQLFWATQWPPPIWMVLKAISLKDEERYNANDCCTLNVLYRIQVLAAIVLNMFISSWCQVFLKPYILIKYFTYIHTYIHTYISFHKSKTMDMKGVISKNKYKKF
jgi:hypothetical protein